ncbi:MAG: hypothetical protein P9L88_05365 [Candidatus Tantalella remota]|nr:hypothetical protein [Candidatus Tantalella remota]
MNRYLVTILVVCSFLLLACGCGEQGADEPGVVEYVTGKEQIKTYEKAGVKIDEINRTLKERYRETD